MNEIPLKCVTETSDSHITFKECRSSICFLNPERRTYKRIIVDGCAIVDGQKCDYLLTKSDGKEERFVELKGTEIIHGLDQLKETIKQLGECLDGRKAYLVFTAIAPALTPRIQKETKLFKSKFNAELIVKKTPWQEKLY